MSEINYLDIEDEIKAILQADESSSIINGVNVTFEVEENFNLIADNTPYVGIYLESWETPADEEYIGGANQHTTKIIIKIWCYEFSLEARKAAKKRDLLFQKIKEILKGDRQLNNKVQVTRFKGGEFDNAQNDEGFFKGVSINLECEVRE